jgi:anti-anti-sigma factor
MSLLTLTTSQEREAVHVALEGELDLSSALLFDEELRRIEEDRPNGTVVLDLSALKFMDSTGLRLILSAHQRARRAGHRLRVIPGSDAIRRIFRLTGVWKRLDIVEDADDAPAPDRAPNGA